MENEGWKDYEGKNVYIETRSNRRYSGKVILVEIKEPLIWISIIDKFGAKITFVHSEINLIQEEKE